MNARPEDDLEPFLDPVEVREATIAAAKAAGDEYRRLNALLYATRWTPADSRALLRELAARDGVEWVENAWRRNPEPEERPAKSFPERACVECGTLFTPKATNGKFCRRQCRQESINARQRDAAARQRAKKAKATTP